MEKYMKLLKKVLALSLLGGSSLFVHAANVTSSMQTTASIQAMCELTMENIDFGDMSPINILSKGMIQELFVKCTKDTTYSIGISNGNGTISQRYMGSVEGGNTDTLPYNIYTDATRTTVVGNGGEGSLITGTGTGEDVGHQFYAYSDAKYIRAGNYSDSLVMTITY